MVLWFFICAAAVATAIFIVQYLMDHIYINTTGKYVLITGCDSGFGNLLARTLGRHRGCRVIAACLTQDAVAQLKREMACADQTVTPIQMDVTSSESIKRAYEEVKAIIPQGQGLWGIVNNAGINQPYGAYHWLNRQEITDIFQVNFMGTVEVTSTFLPLLLQARGRIVNMSSCSVMLPFVESTYTASKMAVEAYSDNVRVRMRRHGITVHILQPGGFKTNLSNPQNILKSHKKMWDRLSKEEQEQFGGIEMFKKEQDMMIKGLQATSSNLQLVTGAMEHALCARWPWRRYLPGFDAKYIFKPMSLLPPIVTDFLASLFL